MAEVASRRIGSRWIDGHPSPAEVAEWFLDNVRVHDGLKPEDYLSGVVIISQSQKMKVAKTNDSGARLIVEEERMTHTPYMRVDTRIDYFWRWMALHPDWVGVIEPSLIDPILDPPEIRNDFLPPGFFRYTVHAGTKETSYIACSQRVGVYERESWPLAVERAAPTRPRPIFAPCSGTKAVPVQNRWGPDDDAIMKAETSAVGRALGMLGVLVLGSGVATAEDMEAPPSSDDAQLPAATEAAAEVADPAEAIKKMIAQLESDHPATFAEVESWARGRKIDLNAPKTDQARAVVRRLEAALADATS